MSQTLLWHDYETFGPDPRRDQPAQFAALRTDEELKEQDDPVVLFCQPSRDRLPHPESVTITGITPQHALQEGRPEPEFAARVMAEMMVPETCSVGYNSLRFDDECSRHLFWRNLFPPYEREHRHGNSRWDVINLMRLAYATRPDGLEWPLRDDGAPSFRLEDLSRANGLRHDAHDALADVRATLSMTRRLRAAQPRLYDYCWRGRGRVHAEALLEADRPCVHVSSRYPASRGGLAVVARVGRDDRNARQYYVFDLTCDPTPLLELSAEDIADRLFTPSADLPEGVERIPLKGVASNKCPVLVTAGLLKGIDLERIGIDRDAIARHWRLLKPALPELAGKVAEVFALGRGEFDGDVETALYDGFVPGTEQRLLDGLRAGAPDSLLSPPAFDDTRLADLLFHHLARHWPERLDPAGEARWRDLCQGRLQWGHGGHRSLEAFLHALAAVRAERPEAASLMDQVEAWGREVVTGLDLEWPEAGPDG